MAEIISWDNSKYSVKIQSIDEQHQKLFKLINDLYDALTKGEAHQKMAAILNELYDYTKYHFGNEENYFKKFCYAQCDAHTDEHCTFAKKVAEFKKSFEEGNVTISKDLLYFLKNWLINHIGNSDKKYSGFLLEQGVK